MIDNSPQSPSPFISRIFMKPKDMDKIVLPNGLTMKEKRISKGMTIEDVTNIGDLTVGSLEKWERHQDLPNALEVKKLAMAYGMPVFEIRFPAGCYTGRHSDDVDVFPFGIRGVTPFSNNRCSSSGWRARRQGSGPARRSSASHPPWARQPGSL